MAPNVDTATTVYYYVASDSTTTSGECFRQVTYYDHYVTVGEEPEPPEPPAEDKPEEPPEPPDTLFRSVSLELAPCQIRRQRPPQLPSTYG